VGLLPLLLRVLLLLLLLRSPAKVASCFQQGTPLTCFPMLLIISSTQNTRCCCCS
jgi:hypothetical protein